MFSCCSDIIRQGTKTKLSVIQESFVIILVRVVLTDLVI